MELVKLGAWTIELDKNKTENFYKGYHFITEDCSCDYCKNYILACENFALEIKELFSTLGIDPRKEGEVFELMKNENRTHQYSGFYHIVGRIVSGPKLWDPKLNKSDDSSLFIGNLDSIEFGFSEDLALVPDNFPSPVIQFEFQINIPWLLN